MKRADLGKYIITIPADQLYPDGWRVVLRREEGGFSVALKEGAPEGPPVSIDRNEVVLDLARLFEPSSSGVNIYRKEEGG